MSFQSFMFPRHFNKASVLTPFVLSSAMMGAGVYALKEDSPKSATFAFTVSAMAAMRSRTNRVIAGIRETMARLDDVEDFIGGHAGGQQAVFVDMRTGESHVFVFGGGFPQQDPNVIDVEAREIKDHTGPVQTLR